MRKIYYLALPIVLVSTGIRAQDSTRVTTLKEVVISASRMEQPVIDVPRSVTVISAEAIRNSVYQSVGELLNTQGGLFVVGANQTPGTNQNIFMRGANSNQVAVLVDGMRITDPSSPNAAIDFSEMSLTNVERIEVIRGSHSTLFGGAAIGGVINIITRKGAETGVHGDASWQGGALGGDAWTSTETFNISYGAEGGFYARGSLMRQDVGGLDASDDANASPSFTADRDDFRKTDAMVKAGFRKDKFDASASYKRVHQYTEIDDGAFLDDENSLLIFDRHLLHYSAAYDLNATLKLMASGSFSTSERFFEDDSSQVSSAEWDHVFSTGTYYGRLQTHEVQASYEGKRFHGVVGTGIYTEKMFFDSYVLLNDPAFPLEIITNYDSLDTRTTTGYLFATGGYSWGKFEMSAGARLSRHTEAGTFATFEVNPSYSFNNFLVYASISAGFNPPSLYQLYDPSRSFGAFATRGNPALEPEESISLEAGVKNQFSSGSYMTLAAFRTQVRNGIEYVYLWNGQKAITDLDFMDDRGDRYINVGEQEVRGIELEGLVKLNDKLTLTGNVSLLEAMVRATPEDVDVTFTGGHHIQLFNLGRFLDQQFEESDVVRRPSVTAFSRLAWQPVQEVTLYATYRHTGQRYDAGYDGSLGPYGALVPIEVASYHLADAGVNWRVSEVLSVAFKTENVLDEEYREVVGFRTRGRSFYLKVNLRF